MNVLTLLGATGTTTDERHFHLTSTIRTTALISSLATSVLATVLLTQSADPATARSACAATTALLGAECRRQSSADRTLAKAVCANLSGDKARSRCLRRASARAEKAFKLCRRQETARANLCRKVGPKPYAPIIDAKNFTTKIDNPYFPLIPGTTFIYKGEDETIKTTVTSRTVKIHGVRCVVVRDVAYEGNTVIEDTEDYYAQDNDGNVWYFGEATSEFSNGVSVSTAGSWIAGVGGAKPGIIMPAKPVVGMTYRQEFAVTDAEDAASVIGTGASVTVPFGHFKNVLETRDFTPLEPRQREKKYYAAGIGLVLVVDPETGEREELKQILRR